MATASAATRRLCPCPPATEGGRRVGGAPKALWLKRHGISYRSIPRLTRAMAVPTITDYSSPSLDNNAKGASAEQPPTANHRQIGGEPADRPLEKSQAREGAAVARTPGPYGSMCECPKGPPRNKTSAAGLGDNLGRYTIRSQARYIVMRNLNHHKRSYSAKGAVAPTGIQRSQRISCSLHRLHPSSTQLLKTAAQSRDGIRRCAQRSCFLNPRHHAALPSKISPRVLRFPFYPCHAWWSFSFVLVPIPDHPMPQSSSEGSSRMAAVQFRLSHRLPPRIPAVCFAKLDLTGVTHPRGAPAVPHRPASPSNPCS